MEITIRQLAVADCPSPQHPTRLYVTGPVLTAPTRTERLNSKGSRDSVPALQAPTLVGSTRRDYPQQHRHDQEKPVLLTVDQAADRLGTTARFIRRLRVERRIAIIKLGKHIRVDSNNLDAYITASRQEANARAS